MTLRGIVVSIVWKLLRKHLDDSMDMSNHKLESSNGSLFVLNEATIPLEAFTTSASADLRPEDPPEFQAVPHYDNLKSIGISRATADAWVAQAVIKARSTRQ